MSRVYVDLISTKYVMFFYSCFPFWYESSLHYPEAETRNHYYIRNTETEIIEVDKTLWFFM